MALRHLAVAGGVAFLSAHLFRAMRAQRQEDAQSAPRASTTDRAGDMAPPANARTDDLLDAGESSGGEPGRAVSSSALEGAQGVEALKRRERPELGLPSDTSNDADRARPGLGDFARGA